LYSESNNMQNVNSEITTEHVELALASMAEADGLRDRTVRFAGQEFTIKDDSVKKGKTKTSTGVVQSAPLDPTAALSKELKIATITSISKSKLDWEEFKTSKLSQKRQLKCKNSNMMDLFAKELF